MSYVLSRLQSIWMSKKEDSSRRHSMLVWINGVNGVGKTSVVNRVAEIVMNEDVVFLDADTELEQFCNHCNESGDMEMQIKYLFSGNSPQNHPYFVPYLKNLILEKEQSGKIVLVSMTVSSIVGKENYIDYFSKRTNLVHIILTADKNTVYQRIDGHTCRSQKRENKESFDNDFDFISKHFGNACFINTNAKSINEVAGSIVDLLNINVP